MIRREAIVGLLGLLVLPFSRLFGKQPQLVGNPRYNLRSHNELCKKTPKGLERVEWEDMQPGDENVVIDWIDGRIVEITDAGTSLSCRDKLNNPYPGRGIVCDIQSKGE